MSYSHAAAAYREREVKTANPARLMLMVFDHAAANLMRARMAMQAGNIEERNACVAKVREAVMELLVTVDEERGGDIARNLKRLYAFFFAQLLEVTRRNDIVLLDRIAKMFNEIRGAFATIVTDTAQTPAA